MRLLFDAAPAILGDRHQARFEGQAAMELEALAGPHAGARFLFPILAAPQGQLILGPLPLLAPLGERRASGASVEALAAAYHDSGVAAMVAVVRRGCDNRYIGVVGVGGGTFQNARLLEGVA